MNEEMVHINFSGIISMKIFKFRADDTDFEGDWEKEYVQELIKTLKQGMTVYDIGAENGELTVLAGKLVGGENVHIFEPNKDYFPNIKAIWGANNLKAPAACFNGYVAEKSTKVVVYDSLEALSYGKDIFYGCYHANPQITPLQSVSLDRYSNSVKIPDVIIMDIEGAELSAVRGAQDLIKEHSPIFFISIHPQYIQERSNGTKEDLLKIFTDNGYEAIHLSTDHEEHYKFIKT